MLNTCSRGTVEKFCSVFYDQTELIRAIRERSLNIGEGGWRKIRGTWKKSLFIRGDLNFFDIPRGALKYFMIFYKLY